MQLSFHAYFLLTIIPVAGALILCASSVYAKSNFSDARMAYARSVFTPEEAPTIITYVGVEDAAVSKAQSMVPLVLDLASYAIVAYFGVRTWLHVRLQMQATAPTPKAIAVNRQLTMVLLFQAFTPIVFGVGLSNVVQLMNVSAVSQSFLSLSFYSAANNWIPVANGLFSLVVIRPYRLATLNYLRYCFCLGAKPPAAIASTTVHVRAISNIAPSQWQTAVI